MILTCVIDILHANRNKDSSVGGGGNTANSYDRDKNKNVVNNSVTLRLLAAAIVNLMTACIAQLSMMQ